MNIIESSRSFNYDIRSLLAYPPPPPYHEVVITISGLPGSINRNTWNGLENGTHLLDGVETIVEGEQHRWTFHQSYGDKLNMFRFCSSDVYTSSTWKVSIYQPSNTSILTEDGWRGGKKLATEILSIRDWCFSTCTIRGITFTWSKGANWSKGNM